MEKDEKTTVFTVDKEVKKTNTKKADVDKASTKAKTVKSIEKPKAEVKKESSKQKEPNKQKGDGKEKKPNPNEPKWKTILKDVRTYFVAVFAIIMIIFMYQIWKINMLPMKFLIPVCIVLLLIAAGLMWMQYSHKINKFNRILGKGLMVIFSILMIVGCVYLSQANTAIDKVTVEAGDKEYEVVSVVVKKENKAEELMDVKSGTFAIPDKIDQEHTKATVEDINKQLSTTIKTETFTNTNDQAQALLDDKVDAMILNEAYRSLLDEKFPSFDEDTKVIYTYKIEKEVKEIGKKANVITDPYNIYISGIDTYGPIATKSRSDVNMIATVNPTTKEILLTSIPRDFYVAQTCQGNAQDKLTHTGIFGVDCTVESMQNFTGLTFNYYVRVNFSSLENIVDAIGGIDIYNQMAFYSGVDGTFIPGGDIHLNGNTALKFARERHAYADGDRQRGRNQMIVLEGIIQKATSPAIITGYSGIMEAVGDSFQTNMTKDEMTSIIKDQLDNGGSWNIQQQSVTGEGGTDWTPANGFNAYVMYPDQTSVNTALANIKAVMAGQTVTLE